MSLFPIRSTVESRGDDEPRLLRLDSEDAAPVLDALASETARRVLAAVHEEPSTKSDIAERVDTSLQNASYHLEKLEEAGLVEVVDTWYSSRGREMPVYGAASGPVVVFAGEEEPSPDFRKALTSAVGALGVLGLLSLVVQWVAGLVPARPEPTTFQASGDDAAVAGDAAATGAEATRTTAEVEMAAEGGANATQEAARAATTTTQAAGGDVGFLAGVADWLVGLPPGALFFAGGAALVLLGVGWWYVRTR